MTTDQDRSGDAAASKKPTTWFTRHRRAAIGAAGVATVLGGGALLLGSQTNDGSQSGGAPDVEAIGPAVATPSLSAPPSAAPAASADAVNSASSESPAAPATTTKATGPTKATGGTGAAKSEPPKLRPIQPNVKAAAINPATVTTATVQKGGESVKVVSARTDLTGYEELSWVSGKGKEYGAARCTQTIQLSPDVPARERPTLLLCWRTSDKRSVYTLSVVPDGRPIPATSVEVLKNAWSKMS